MRWLGGLALASLLALGSARAVCADDPAAGGSPGAPRAQDGALAHGLAVLRARMAAKLKEADLLQEAGKPEQALAATREVERLYREGMADLERLLAALASRGTPLPGGPPTPAVPALRGADDDQDWDSGLVLRTFAGRGGRKTRGGPGGARVRREDAVEHGLRWLAAHQSPDGGWEAAGFDRWCDGKPQDGDRADGRGDARFDVGVTGLALSAFLGAGYTHRGDHPFAAVVRRGLVHLKQVQDPEGCFGPRESVQFVYNHARAALAMVEAYGMTGAPALHRSAQRALDFIALCRNPYFVWRFGVKPGDNDTSVTGWMALPLLSARRLDADAVREGRPAPLVVDEAAFRGISAWLDKMTDPDLGRVGYFSRGGPVARPVESVRRFPAEKSESMTAVGVLLRVGMDPAALGSDAVKRGAQLVARLPPTWDVSDGSIDFEHWYFGTMALWQVGGEAWARWDRALDEVLGSQRLEGEYCGSKGSWDPVDPWSPDLGRVYSTAIVTLCLEATYRYDRVAPPR